MLNTGQTIIFFSTAVNNLICYFNWIIAGVWIIKSILKQIIKYYIQHLSWSGKKKNSHLKIPVICWQMKGVLFIIKNDLTF